MGNNGQLGGIKNIGSSIIGLAGGASVLGLPGYGAGAAIGKPLSLTPKGIVDGYFAKSGRKAKKSYTAGDIARIVSAVTNKMAQLDFAAAHTLMVRYADEYGLSISEAMEYFNSNKELFAPVFFGEDWKGTSMGKDLVNAGKSVIGVVQDGVSGLVDYVADATGLSSVKTGVRFAVYGVCGLIVIWAGSKLFRYNKRKFKFK